jgi:hypothetical protein
MDVRGFMDVRGIEAEFVSFNKDGRHWLSRYIPYDFDTYNSNTFANQDELKPSGA